MATSVRRSAHRRTIGAALAAVSLAAGAVSCSKGGEESPEMLVGVGEPGVVDGREVSPVEIGEVTGVDLRPPPEGAV